MVVVVVVALLDDFSLSSSASRAFVAVVIIIIEEEEEEKVDFSPLLSFLETRAAPRKRILSDLDEEQDEEEEEEEEEERRNDFAPRRAKSMCRAKSLSLSLSFSVVLLRQKVSTFPNELFIIPLLESAICAMHIHALQR